MPLRINTNVPSINAQRIGKINNRDLKVRLERLSSGLRINRAADDASGLSVSEGMRAEISGMRQGASNAQQAINLIQTAEGALNEVGAMLIRMRELSVQAASSTVNDANRESINAEFVQLINEMDRVASVTSYNNSSILSGFGNELETDAGISTALASTTTGVFNVQLSAAASGTYTFIDSSGGDNQITLGNGIATQTIDIGPALDHDGSGVVATGSSVVANFDRLGVALTLGGTRPGGPVNPATDGYRDGDLDGTQLLIVEGTGGKFQIGPDNKAGDRIEVTIQDMRASGTFLNVGGNSLSTLASAQQAITNVDLAITKVSQVRGDLGAAQNRLNFNLRNTENSIENNVASEATIRDADIPMEVSAFTKAQILVQSTTAMMAQANVLSQNALSLLQ